MRYFIMEQDEKYSDSPNIINWFGKINVQKLKQGQSWELPDRTLLEIRNNPDTIFTDVVSKPFLIYSKKTKDAVSIYESGIVHKQIVLLDDKNLMTELYYLPILKMIDCLSEKSELNTDKSIVRRAVLDKSKLPNRSIFVLDGLSSIYAVVRLDLAESLLRRGVRGITLRKVEIDEGE